MECNFWSLTILIILISNQELRYFKLKLLMEINTWFAFVIASLGTLIVPDPSSLLALTHGAIHGYKKHNLLYSAVLWADVC